MLKQETLRYKGSRRGRPRMAMPSCWIASLLRHSAKEMCFAEPTPTSLQITLLTIKERKAESPSLALESSPPTLSTNSVHLGDF
jgi:hypothetical protein